MSRLADSSSSTPSSSTSSSSAATLRFTCSRCRFRGNLPASYAGKAIRCPGCESPQLVPGSSPTSSALAVVSPQPPRPQPTGASVDFVCGACAAHARVRADLMGQVVFCPACKAVGIVDGRGPQADATAPAAPEAPAATNDFVCATCDHHSRVIPSTVGGTIYCPGCGASQPLGDEPAAGGDPLGQPEDQVVFEDPEDQVVFQEPAGSDLDLVLAPDRSVRDGSRRIARPGPPAAAPRPQVRARVQGEPPPAAAPIAPVAPRAALPVAPVAPVAARGAGQSPAVPPTPRPAASPSVEPPVAPAPAPHAAANASVEARVASAPAPRAAANASAESPVAPAPAPVIRRAAGPTTSARNLPRATSGSSRPAAETEAPPAQRSLSIGMRLVTGTTGALLRAMVRVNIIQFAKLRAKNRVLRDLRQRLDRELLLRRQLEADLRTGSAPADRHVQPDAPTAPTAPDADGAAPAPGASTTSIADATPAPAVDERPVADGQPTDAADGTALADALLEGTDRGMAAEAPPDRQIAPAAEAGDSTVHAAQADGPEATAIAADDSAIHAAQADGDEAPAAEAGDSATPEVHLAHAAAPIDERSAAVDAPGALPAPGADEAMASDAEARVVGEAPSLDGAPSATDAEAATAPADAPQPDSLPTAAGAAAGDAAGGADQATADGAGPAATGGGAGMPASDAGAEAPAKPGRGRAKRPRAEAKRKPRKPRAG